MTKVKSVKHAMLMSLLALVVCLSMFVGSTFAWFTDSVTSTGNKIQSGTLKLDLEVLDKDGNWNSIKNSTDPIFNYDKWEPGHTDVKILKLENKGSLALKWVAKFVTEYELTILADVIDVYLCTSETELAYPESRDLLGYTKLGTVREFVNTLKNAEEGTLLAGGEVFVGIALHMQESAGNDYQNLPLVEAPGTGFDIKVLATQYTHEEDSFDNQYDAIAKYPLAVPSVLTEDMGDHKLTVKIPEGAPAYEYVMALSGYSFTNDDSNAVLKFDLGLVDENGLPLQTSVECPVSIKLSHPFVNMDNFQVIHNGEVVEDATYDDKTQTINFTVSHFSPFEIKYIDYVDPSYELEYEVEKEQYVITKGMFFVNPVNFFDTVPLILDRKAVLGSDGIAVDFTKDGITYFVVSDRTTTIFVAPDATAQYVGINGTFDASNVDFRTNQSGKLWNLISGLQANEYNTLYLLPGTYNEATTIYIYSSMDIIGLGDTDEVKVVKGSSSNSNRHLFNATGTKNDYIEVTLRNMTLDATANTTGGKDNAAVQSIRKSKVKCYDLNILKGTGWSAVAFYVNGNNAVDGVKYPAYMYVQDCVLNVKQAFNVVTASASYKFYHSGLVYSGKAYTTNNSNNKNVVMSANDWWN